MDMSKIEIFMGALFIGLILSICFYGITIVQTWMYFNVFKKDPTWRKFLVGFLFILGTAISMVNVTFTYQTFIPYFRNAPDAYLLILCNVILLDIISTTIQLFFAWRIQVLTSSNWFTSVIVICILASFSSGVATAIAASRMNGTIFMNISEFHKFQPAMLAWFVSDTLTDVILTGTLVWYLKSNKTGFKDMDDVIDKIIRLTIPTGMITTVFIVAFIILFYLDTTHVIENVVYYSIPQLAIISVLSSLNSRRRPGNLRSESGQKGRGQPSSAPQTKEGWQVCAGEGQGPVGPMSNKHPEVFVQVESQEMIDISRRKMPTHNDDYYVSGWESDLPDV